MDEHCDLDGLQEPLVMSIRSNENMLIASEVKLGKLLPGVTFCEWVYFNFSMYVKVSIFQYDIKLRLKVVHGGYIYILRAASTTRALFFRSKIIISLL